MSTLQATVPQGAQVLITGVTGFVGSHTAKEFLKRGYKVRGTVRDLNKASWLVDDLFKSYVDTGDFELVLVKDFAIEGAFDDAIKGVSAIAHIAALVTGDTDPNMVIPQTVTGVTTLLKSALREPSVKAFVFTSTIGAAANPMPGFDTYVDSNTWNDLATKVAWAPPPYDESRIQAVYMASKVAAEKALWEFTEKEKPHFNVNVISPGPILGEGFHKAHNEGMGAWMKLLYEGTADLLSAMMSNPDVKNTRLQTWGRLTEWNEMLHILRKAFPGVKFVDDTPDLPKTGVTTDHGPSFVLLKKWGGQDGWRALEDTIVENFKALEKSMASG